MKTVKVLRCSTAVPRLPLVKGLYAGIRPSVILGAKALMTITGEELGEADNLQPSSSLSTRSLFGRPTPKNGGWMAQCRVRPPDKALDGEPKRCCTLNYL